MCINATPGERVYGRLSIGLQTSRITGLHCSMKVNTGVQTVGIWSCVAHFRAAFGALLVAFTSVAISILLTLATIVKVEIEVA